MGALLSGVLKIIADAIKDRRASRTEHESALRSAYEEWASCIEEAKGVAAYYASSAGDNDEREDSNKRQRRAFEVQQRLGTHACGVAGRR